MDEEEDHHKLNAWEEEYKRSWDILHEENGQLNDCKCTDCGDTADGSSQTAIQQEQTWHDKQTGNNRSHSSPANGGHKGR